ncbi:MAG: Asp-tRNA(Asn)/Glu-tRNA(Gln) amidotransferase subunit GatA [Thermotogae bacterium]|nr:Asp-tRNA(Asn)/Glu-tRNA(Gln) amidotransferase subunit GatA [Thermotogota bacterium]
MWNYDAIFQKLKRNELNAVITVVEPEGGSGPLNGLPIAIKDNIITKGVRTTAASKILDNYIPPYDATVVKRLKEAGAVIMAKANLDEFAMGSTGESSAFGPTKNPHIPTLVPGGSSSGSAALVGGGYVPVALGSDTGGSVRLPAAFCNVWSLKPTYGRVSRYGLIAFASSLDVIGPIANDIDLLARVMEVISGPDPRDATSLNLPKFSYAKVREFSMRDRWRLGVVEEHLKEVSKEVKLKFESFLAKLHREGHEITFLNLKSGKFALASYYVIATAEASSNLARYDGVRFGVRVEGETLEETYIKTRSLFGKEVKRRILMGTFVLSHGYYDAYYLQALKVRRLVKEEVENWFKDVDLVLTPTNPTSPPPIGAGFSPVEYYRLDTLTVPFSLSGVPVLNVPLGDFVGVQVVAPFGLDERAVGFGRYVKSLL